MNSIEFPCRWGPNKYRQELYHSYLSSNASGLLAPDGTPYLNSYLVVRMDKKNEWAIAHNEDAIEVMSLGETYGTIGYVGREYVERVKEFFRANGLTWRRTSYPPYKLLPKEGTEEHNQVWLTLTMEGGTV